MYVVTYIHKGSPGSTKRYVSEKNANRFGMRSVPVNSRAVRIRKVD